MRKFAYSLIFLLLFCACRTAPPPGEPPRFELVFDRIEAGSIHQIVLFFSLKTENPRLEPLGFSIKGQKITINGFGADPETAKLYIVETENPEILADPQKASMEVEGEGEAEIILALHLELESAADILRPIKAADEDNYRVELKLDMAYQYGASKPQGSEISTEAVFPRISEPEFTITAIAILQAELINTRFRVSLQIDNRNAFPVTLSSFKYELYGDGMFWADGQERNVLHIPAKGSAKTNLFLLMNFINMKRHLLDEIIAMRLVNYRFAGNAEVDIEVPWLPHFGMKFDRSGLSEVFQ